MLLRDVLRMVANGEISVDEAERRLRLDIVGKVSTIARLDISREIRRGLPEVVLAEGKTISDLLQICAAMLENSGRVIVSRASKDQRERLKDQFSNRFEVSEPPHAACIVIKEKGSEATLTGGRVGILTAGTVDLAVAEEAALIATEMGCEVTVEADVGVAGLHRIIEPLSRMIKDDVDCLIVVAGREGALPTVVAGLVDIPVIGVPTSSGYGYGGSGEGALMAMLQGCSLGLAVVNIDSGIAAGVVAAQIANRAAKARKNSETPSAQPGNIRSVSKLNQS